jgi:RES domain-containing protein
MLSGQGSLENGGRWNAPGSFPAIYGSLTPETALSEALEQPRYFGLKGHTAFPRGIVAIEVKVANLLDLTSGILRKHLLVSQERMLTADWRKEQDEGKESLPQTLGRAAYRVGFEALLVPSKADLSGANLVIFPGNLKANSSVTYLNETELPE